MHKQIQMPVAAGAHAVGKAVYVAAHRALLDVLQKGIARARRASLYFQRQIIAQQIRDANGDVLQTRIQDSRRRRLHFQLVAAYPEFARDVFDTRPILVEFHHNTPRMPADFEQCIFRAV